MNLPYHVSSKETSSLRLWRNKDHRFRIIEYDKMIPFLRNIDYILIEDGLSEPFEYFLKDQLEILPVLIERNQTKEIWSNYKELKIKNYLNPANINAIDTYGIDAWQYSHELFVSPELKEELDFIAKGSLAFSKGFSLFA